MAAQALLIGLGQVVRQDQYAVGALALGFDRVLDRDARAIASTRDNRHIALADINGGANDAGVFILGQREELACAARGKQRAGVVALQPFKALLIRRLVEVLLRIKI